MQENARNNEYFLFCVRKHYIFAISRLLIAELRRILKTSKEKLCFVYFILFCLNRLSLFSLLRAAGRVRHQGHQPRRCCLHRLLIC